MYPIVLARIAKHTPELHLQEVLYKIINDNIKILKLFKLAKFPNVSTDINNCFAEECSVFCTENTDTLA